MIILPLTLDAQPNVKVLAHRLRRVRLNEAQSEALLECLLILLESEAPLERGGAKGEETMTFRLLLDVRPERHEAVGRLSLTRLDVGQSAALLLLLDSLPAASKRAAPVS